MSISNASTSARSYYAFMTSDAFQQGYTDSRTDQPFAYAAFAATRDQVRYERGRLFALIYVAKGTALFVDKNAIDNFKQVCQRKEIV